MPHASRTAGDVSTQASPGHTVYQAVDTGTDLVLPDVEAGHEIVVGASIRWAGSQTGTPVVDVATMVSGSPVNYLSGRSATDAGVQCWAGPNGTAGSSGGGVMYTVQAGDIVSGTVTLRILFRNTSNNVRTIVAGTANPFQWWASNLDRAV